MAMCAVTKTYVFNLFSGGRMKIQQLVFPMRIELCYRTRGVLATS